MHTFVHATETLVVRMCWNLQDRLTNIDVVRLSDQLSLHLTVDHVIERVHGWAHAPYAPFDDEEGCDLKYLGPVVESDMAWLDESAFRPTIDELIADRMSDVLPEMVSAVLQGYRFVQRAFPHIDFFKHWMHCATECKVKFVRFIALRDRATDPMRCAERCARKWRPCARRYRAGSTIVKAIEHAWCDPSTPLCRRRLLREFNDMADDDANQQVQLVAEKVPVHMFIREDQFEPPGFLCDFYDQDDDYLMGRT